MRVVFLNPNTACHSCQHPPRNCDDDDEDDDDDDGSGGDDDVNPVALAAAILQGRSRSHYFTLSLLETGVSLCQLSSEDYSSLFIFFLHEQFLHFCGGEVPRGLIKPIKQEFLLRA